jgi:phospholipase/carboxylesterase
MNRMQLRISLNESLLTHNSDTASSETQCRGVPHTVFVPLHYEPNYAYPLLVWLHGPHDDERQVQRVMPELSLRNYVGVGPRAGSRDEPGFTWSDEDLLGAEQSVFECIDAVLARYNIARHRVFLAGFDVGGTMALRLGLRHPGLFAGALSVGGPFPLGMNPLTQWDAIRQLPLFIAQGRSSDVYPIDRACEELRLFHAASLSVSVRQYPCGDELTTQMLRDMDSWLMEQVTGIPAEVDSGNSTNDFQALN